MKPFTLKHIDNDFESYQQLIDFYDRSKENTFDTIDLSFQQGFAANLSAALGGIL